LARSSSSAVGKALDLVEIVARADRPMRLSEVANEADMHRATAYRVLAELVARGWVLRVDDRYLPGTAVLQLSSLAASNSLAVVSRPVLQSLSDVTSLMVNVQVLEREGSRIVDVVRPPRLEMIADLRGELLPAHKFSGPMALVAMLDDAARTPYLRAALEAGHHLDGPDGLLADLERTRRDGHALVHGRNDQVVSSLGKAVLAPSGHPLCALAVVGLRSELDEHALPKLVAALGEAVTELTLRLSERTSARE